MEREINANDFRILAIEPRQTTPLYSDAVPSSRPV